MAYEKLQIELYKNFRGINQKVSEYLVEDGYFLDLRNFGFERPGALTSRWGYADHATLSSQTFSTLPSILHPYNFNTIGPDGSKSSGSFLLFNSGSGLFDLYNLTASLGFTFPLGGPSLSSGSLVDGVVADNKFYFCDGTHFGELDATVSTFYSVPEQLPRINNSFLYLGGVTFISNATIGSGSTKIVASGTYAFRFSYVKGFNPPQIGQYWDGPTTDPNFALYETYFNVSATFVGKTAAFRLLGVTFPISLETFYEGFGTLRRGVVHMKRPNTTDFVSSNPVGFDGPALARYLEASIDNFPAGESDMVPQFTLVPRFLEYFKNMLFAAGFSSQASVIWYSELAKPYQILPENFFEVRTDDADSITCLQPFQSSLIVFKNRSMHEVSGESPETLSLKEISSQYGCVNNQASVVFKNRLWFVDEKGICEFNGSQVFMVSDPVESTFQSLDKSKAKAVNFSKRDEVWFCFGDVCLVYNYEVDAWSTFDNIEIENVTGAKTLDAFDRDLLFFEQGSSFLYLSRFSSSFTTDRGQNITLSFDAPYFKRMGESTQELFRRFYLDCDISQSTPSVTLELRSNYSDSTSLALGWTQSTFQKKVEFGVSAKSLSPRVIMQSQSAVTVNGYALHSRFLRKV